TDALLRLNVSPRHKGFPLVREAILMHPQNESRSMTKEVYPELTRLFDASQIQIEHAIRTAIHAAWEHRELRVWAQYFPLDPSGDVSRPTNAGFITRLSAALQIGRL
ncbi:MAG: sporulation initiation factor Spo0A C-terminal domain-containing protein, partial [Firmicutes bacterium]|nr:sporulation initiation factor Spo0A C-terminal domain-containing protein [Bacillota bacterium]